MADFSIEISNYKNYGTYIYKFDDVGNELLNPSSSIFQQVYFVLPFGNVVYDNSKIALFYDPTFKEFVPQTGSESVSVFPQEAIDQINVITADNIELQNQLLSLIGNSEQNSSAADASLVKNIIISLRIQLGQGTTTSDFDTVFPYMPIPVELRDSTTSVQVVPSSATSTIQPTILTTTSITSNSEQPPIQSVKPSDLGELTDSERMAISASLGGGATTPTTPTMRGAVTFVRVQKNVITNNHMVDSKGHKLGGGYYSYTVKIVDVNNNQIGNQTIELNATVKQDLYLGKTVRINNVNYKAIDPKRGVALNPVTINSSNYIGYS